MHGAFRFAGLAGPLQMPGHMLPLGVELAPEDGPAAAVRSRAERPRVAQLILTLCPGGAERLAIELCAGSPTGSA